MHGRAGESFGSLIITPQRCGSGRGAVLWCSVNVLDGDLASARSGLLGGLVSSLVVALFLLPSAYLHLVPQQDEEAPPRMRKNPQVVAVGAAF